MQRRRFVRKCSVIGLTRYGERALEQVTPFFMAYFKRRRIWKQLSGNVDQGLDVRVLKVEKPSHGLMLGEFLVQFLPIQNNSPDHLLLLRLDSRFGGTSRGCVGAFLRLSLVAGSGHERPSCVQPIPDGDTVHRSRANDSRI